MISRMTRLGGIGGGPVPVISIVPILSWWLRGDRGLVVGDQ